MKAVDKEGSCQDPGTECRSSFNGRLSNFMKVAQVVLIEDNLADVFLVELALKENGIAYELTRFKNGQEAVDALCAPGPAAIDAFHRDATLLDLNTPRSDGFEVRETVTRSGPRRRDHRNHHFVASE